MFWEGFLFLVKPLLTQHIRVCFVPRAGHRTRLGWVPVSQAVVVLPGLEPLWNCLMCFVTAAANQPSVFPRLVGYLALPLRRRRAGMAPVVRLF